MTATKRAILFFSFWILALGMMASRLEARLFSLNDKHFSKDPLYLLLGSAKEAIGDTFFLKASSYFHGGVDMDIIRHENDFNTKETQEAHHEESFKKDYTDWVYKINSRIKVMEHRHLEGDETKEILPFLELAVKLDPYNVQAILTTAYWLNGYFGKTDAAIDVLRQGLEKNPDSWEICYQLGLSLFKYKKDYADSAVYLESSLKKMDLANSNQIDHRMAYYYLGEAYLNQGEKAQALGAYQKALSYFAETENHSIKSVIQEKIKSLTT